MMTSIHITNSFINYFLNNPSNLQFEDKPRNINLSNFYVHDAKPKGYHNLPVNILLAIFMYLDEEDLRKSVIPVCHKWKQVAQLPQLWRKLKFQGLHVPQNFICKQLRSLSNLQCVYFINIPDAATVIRQLCRCNPQIVKVAIKNCKKNNSDKLPERCLRNLVASCRKLQEINLKGTPFCGNMFYIEVAVLPELKSINLSNNQFLRTKNIFELILNCQQLEELKLSQRYKNQQLSDHDASFLFSNLKSTLKSITFDTMDLTDISFRILLECEKLEKLYLINAVNMSPETFTSIWKKLPNLKYLKINNLQISAQHFVEFFSNGRYVLWNLKILNLAGSWKLNGDGVKAISECCPNLEKAIFKCCKNIERNNDLVENCQKLTTLNFAFCDKLTDDNIINLTELSNLQTLYIDINRQSTFETLKWKQPNLEIYICLSPFNKNVERFHFK